MGLEFLIKIFFLKAGLTTALLLKTAIPGRVFPSGGTPHELYVPLITAVPLLNPKFPLPPSSLLIMTKIFQTFFPSLHDKGQHNKLKDANFTVLLKY